MLGPRLIKQVRCKACRATFRGNTGKSCTRFIVGYIIVTGIVAIVGVIAFMHAIR
jgi:hypothetical protein